VAVQLASVLAWRLLCCMTVGKITPTRQLGSTQLFADIFVTGA